MFDPLLDPPEISDEEWDRIIGSPPEWFYPLIGEVAVEAVRVDYYLVMAGLQLVSGRCDSCGGPACGEQPSHKEVLVHLRGPSKIRDVLESVKGRSEAFDAARKERDRLAEQRNSIVHAVVQWGDLSIMQTIHDPVTGRTRYEEWVGDGWSRQDPKTGIEQPLTGEARVEMERTLAEMKVLTLRAFNLAHDGGA